MLLSGQTKESEGIPKTKFVILMYKFILLLFTAFVIQSCTISNEKIENESWKLSSAKPVVQQVAIPSTLFFKTKKYNTSLRNDTIFIDDMPWGIITDRRCGIGSIRQDQIDVLVLNSNYDVLTYVAY